jgi:hypothetical protein
MMPSRPGQNFDFVDDVLVQITWLALRGRQDGSVVSPPDRKWGTLRHKKLGTIRVSNR